MLNMIGIIEDVTMEVRRSSVDRPTHFMSTSVRADHEYPALAQDIILDPRPIYDGYGCVHQLFKDDQRNQNENVSR